MEGWSPQTLLRTGFCRLDDDDNIVDVWNFREMHDHLNSIDSGDEREENSSPDNGTRELASSAPLCSGVFDDGVDLYHMSTPVSYSSVRGTDGVGRFPLTHELNSADCCPENPDEDGTFFDMPPPEGPEVWRHELEGMPDLEAATDISLHQRYPASLLDIRLSKPASRWTCGTEIYPAWSFYVQFLATVIVMRAIPFSLSLSVEDTAEMMDVLMHVIISSLPRFEHHPTKILDFMAIPYERIDCCAGSSDYVQFLGEHVKDLRNCPICAAHRFEEGVRSSDPRREFTWYPLIPRLQQLYNTPLLDTFMTR
ncbi:hypothetical protein KC19_VG155100 [Ceratodon purpureus]|uniref:Transposase family Tnp2 protein n=1 Tax=Ceratodon purpureus TaxID=3225 RepID=A0A8T0HRK4_CERPU|nr:hypothetical protein KC19_VG155100 [Ceratodon purpureus]